ncbi:MAG: hypothetical protein DME05_17595 [Candidatus Rokuibacteriota bacterium]|nr:MAG: hypothetical protein DME05_17595 [Candidatus Rokubacteria bacterium]
MRESPRLVLDLVVARPLAAPHQGIEHREEIERNQEGPALQELTVVHRLAGRQRILQTPGEADAGVVVRAPGPARIRFAGDRFPETGDALGEPIEGRAEADVPHEREGGALALDAALREAAEPTVAEPMERVGGQQSSLFSGRPLIDHISVAVVKCAA